MSDEGFKNYLKEIPPGQLLRAYKAYVEQTGSLSITHPQREEYRKLTDLAGDEIQRRLEEERK